MTDTTHVRLLLVGAGNVGRRVLDLLVRKQDQLAYKLGLTFSVVGVADSSGVVACPAGLDLPQLIDIKTHGHGVSAYPRWGRLAVSALDMVRSEQADLLLDASPGNLRTGQPGLDCVRTALSHEMHVVAANKSPLVLAYPELQALAVAHGVRLRFDATVAGGLPAVNLGQRDLGIAHVNRLEGILNLTTNYILTRMADAGLAYDQALAEARAAGHAETDPTLDVDGWDAAAKLVILAHSVLDYPATLGDVAVEGIRRLSADDLRRAAHAGQRVKLLAVARHDDAGYRLSVQPTWLDAEHPLARLGAEQMGLVFHTDICGEISAAIVEETPLPTAAAMLRDVVDIYRR